jgi:hypothetical protein
MLACSRPYAGVDTRTSSATHQLFSNYWSMASGTAARFRALAAYKDFLNLWKDADPDIPIVKQAKAENARRQQGRYSSFESR